MTIVNPLTRHRIVKHPGSDGSDTHDTGSDQGEHRPKSAGSRTLGESIEHPKGGTGQVTEEGTELLHVTQQTGLVADSVYLHDFEGNEVPLSHDAFIALGPDDPQVVSYTKQVNALLDRYDIDADQFDNNIRRTYESALLRYEQMNEAGDKGTWTQGIAPAWARELVNMKDRFWDREQRNLWGVDTSAWLPEFKQRVDDLIEIEDGRWRWKPNAGDTLFELDHFYRLWNGAYADGAFGFDLPTLAAVGATISPRLDAWQNFEFTLDLARVVHDNPQVSEKWAKIFQAKLSELEERERINGPDGTDPNTRRFNAGHRTRMEALSGALDLYNSGQPVFLNEIPDYAGAIAAHNYRKEFLAVGTKLAPGYETGSGYGNYAKALSLLQNDVPITEALGGVKTRSFTNNIADPLDAFGRRDSTMDIWAIDSAIGGRGYGNLTSVTGGATFSGVSVGLRAIIKDAYDRVATEFDTIPLRMQEVVWAEIQRGLGNNKSLTWTHADGTKVDMKKAPKK